ncbi:unnamed protein product [Ranitomeya imitator]|uniref:Uncharacterized protein n=1 Tax=Ranitomeya imitator TaxID=111125 RepID=A0ABN9LZF6_9NEOB|nr:unnamed protein product [Ranitomeya imitator]
MRSSPTEARADPHPASDGRPPRWASARATAVGGASTPPPSSVFSSLFPSPYDSGGTTDAWGGGRSGFSPCGVPGRTPSPSPLVRRPPRRLGRERESESERDQADAPEREGRMEKGKTNRPRVATLCVAPGAVGHEAGEPWRPPEASDLALSVQGGFFSRHPPHRPPRTVQHAQSPQWHCTRHSGFFFPPQGDARGCPPAGTDDNGDFPFLRALFLLRGFLSGFSPSID